MAHNLPPGCRTSDIPGNRPEDIALDDALDLFWTRLREAYEAAYRLRDQREMERTHHAFRAWLEAQDLDHLIRAAEDNITFQEAQAHVDDQLSHGLSHTGLSLEEFVGENEHEWSTETPDHLRRDMLYTHLPDHLHDRVPDPDWWKADPVACPDCGNPHHGGHLCRNRTSVVTGTSEHWLTVEDDHGQQHTLPHPRRLHAQHPSIGDHVHLQYHVGIVSTWRIHAHHPCDIDAQDQSVP